MKSVKVYKSAWMIFAISTVLKFSLGIQHASKSQQYAMYRFVSYKLTTMFSTNMRYWDRYFWLTVYVMKTHYKKQKPKTIQYRNYKHFQDQSINFDLNNELLRIDINNTKLKEFNNFFKSSWLKCSEKIVIY